jgi:hypothetical protein
MSCPGCLIALAGFGEDELQGGSAALQPTASAVASDGTLSTEVGASLLGSLGYVILGPVVGAVAFSIFGAVAYSSHRVAGGAMGFLAGGILGGLVGAFLAKRKIEAVLPEIQAAVESMAANNPGAIDTDGTVEPPPGGWTVGPLDLPSGKVDVASMLPGKVSASPSNILGLLSLARAPAPNSAGPLKVSWAISSAAPSATLSASNIPSIVAVAQAKITQSIPPKIQQTAAPTAAAKPSVPPKMPGQPAAVPQSCVDACIATYPSTVPGQMSVQQGTCIMNCAPAPSWDRTCLDDCSKKYLGGTTSWNDCTMRCQSAPSASPAVPVKMPGTASSSAVSMVVAQPQASRVAASSASSVVSAASKAQVASPAASAGSVIGAAIMRALTPSKVIPSSTAVNMVLPSAPAGSKPVLAPVKQSASAAPSSDAVSVIVPQAVASPTRSPSISTQVVQLPAAAAANPAYGSSKTTLAR